MASYQFSIVQDMIKNAKYGKTHSLIIVRNIRAFLAAPTVYLGLVVGYIKGPIVEKNDEKKEKQTSYHDRGRLCELQILTTDAKPKI